MKAISWGRHLVESLDRWTSRLLLANGAVLALSLAILRRFPPAFVDEAWNANRARAWLQTGVNFGSMDSGVMDRFAGYWHFNPLLPSLLQGIVIRLFGANLVPLRILSWSFGVLLLASLYSIIRTLAGTRRDGLIAVLLATTSYAFLKSSHLVRPDIYVAALGYAAIALVLADLQYQQHLSVRSLVGGLLIAAGFEMHPNGVIFVPVIAAMCLVAAGSHILRLRPLWMFTCGLGVGLAGYVWLHILPAPEAYLSISHAFADSRIPPLLAGVRASFDSFGTTIILLAIMSSGRLFGIPFAAAALLHADRRNSVMPLAMLLVGLLAFALLVGEKLDYYAIYLTPLCDIVVALALVRVLANEAAGPGNRWNHLRVLVVSVSVAGMLFTSYLVLQTPPPGDMEKVALRIRSVIPEHSTIMGPQTYWFDLQDHRYLSWEWVSYRQWFGIDNNFEDAMRALHPTVLIMDDHLRHFIHHDKPSAVGTISPFWLERWWSERDLDALLAAHAKLLDTITTDAYGPVQVYALTW